MINILSKQNIFFTALAQFQDIRSYLRDVNTFRAVKLTTNVLYSSIQTGEPRQSFDPWPPVQSRGGGAVIPCHYNIIIRTNTNDATLKLTVAKLKNAIELMPEKSALVVKML